MVVEALGKVLGETSVMEIWILPGLDAIDVEEGHSLRYKVKYLSRKTTIGSSALASIL